MRAVLPCCHAKGPRPGSFCDGSCDASSFFYPWPVRGRKGSDFVVGCLSGIGVVLSACMCHGSEACGTVYCNVALSQSHPGHQGLTCLKVLSVCVRGRLVKPTRKMCRMWMGGDEGRCVGH